MDLVGPFGADGAAGVDAVESGRHLARKVVELIAEAIEEKSGDFALERASCRVAPRRERRPQPGAGAAAAQKPSLFARRQRQVVRVHQNLQIGAIVEHHVDELAVAVFDLPQPARQPSLNHGVGGRHPRAVRPKQRPEVGAQEVVAACRDEHGIDLVAVQELIQEGALSPGHHAQNLILRALQAQQRPVALQRRIPLLVR